MPDTHKMPVYFIGHGNPANVLLDNPYTRSLAAIPATLPYKPKAIMVISAHWVSEGSYASVVGKPDTIYDFYGFPQEMYQLTYPAPGAPDTARRVMELLPEVRENHKWGLDHGAWVLLKHIFPDADIPVFQLSIDDNLSFKEYFELGKKLKPLRDEGILIIGSGNIVHNLRSIRKTGISMRDWAVQFDTWVNDKIEKRDFEAVINYKKYPEVADFPVDEHFVPLLYCLGMADDGEQITTIYDGIDLDRVSMRSLRIG